MEKQGQLEVILMTIPKLTCETMIDYFTKKQEKDHQNNYFELDEVYDKMINYFKKEMNDL